MSRSVYYPTDVRNTLLAAEQSTNAALTAADNNDPYTAGYRAGYQAALTTLALAFGLTAASQPDHSHLLIRS
jgi:hypothetical protein